MKELLAIFLTYLVTGLFGYCMHWFLHQPFAGKYNSAHMTHHLTLYPPKNLISIEYRHAGRDDAVRFFAVVSLPLIGVPIFLGAFNIISWSVVICILLTEAVMGFLHDYLHHAYHIKNHWLNKIPILTKTFQNWKKLHFQHHVLMQTNFGIFTYYWDRIFKTIYKK